MPAPGQAACCAVGWTLIRGVIVGRGVLVGRGVRVGRGVLVGLTVRVYVGVIS
jgi:hypothetical protein